MTLSILLWFQFLHDECCADFIPNAVTVDLTAPNHFDSNICISTTTSMFRSFYSLLTYLSLCAAFSHGCQAPPTPSMSPSPATEPPHLCEAPQPPTAQCEGDIWVVTGTYAPPAPSPQFVHLYAKGRSLVSTAYWKHSDLDN